VHVEAHGLVDATGPRGCVHRALGLSDAGFDAYPGTQTLFSHFEGVLRTNDLPGFGGRTSPARPAPPYPVDDAALHHVFDGGWMWVLRFAHGVTSDEIVLEMLAHPAGYIWSFPRPTHLAIGICAQADAGTGAAALRDRIAAWIRDTRIAEGARLEPYSWPIPSLSARSIEGLEIAGPRWCTIGDAAGLVDPITREGIYFALLSGAWAAEAVLADHLDRYAARVRSEIVPELARAARLKDRFFRLASSGVFISALRRSGAVNAVMADLIAGRQSYAGLKWRLARTLEWRWAWRAMLSARSSRPWRAPGRRVSIP